MCLEKRLCKRFCSCKHAQRGRQQILQLKLGLWINEYSKRIFLDIIPNFVITYNIVYLLGHIITFILRHYIWGYFKLSIRWQGLFFHFICNPLHGLKFRTNFKLTQKLTLFFLSQFILPYLVCDLCALSSTLDWFWSKASKPCNHTSYKLLEM